MKQSLLITLYKDFNNQNIINLNNLRKILYDNMNTDFGLHHDFSSIYNSNHVIDDFRRKVPLSSYDDYKNKEFSCVYKKYIDIKSAGTTGIKKDFSITNETLMRYSPYIYQEPFYIGKAEMNNILHVNIFRKSKDGIDYNDALYNFMKDNKIFRYSDFIGGEPCMFSDEKINVPYLKAWLALANENLSAILSVHLHDVLLFMNYIEKNWKQLLFDIENLSISENFSHNMEETLLNLAKDTPKERISFLRKEFEKGFYSPVMKRIWPKLKIISGIGGILFNPYDKALQQYSGDIPINYFAYGQAECISGIATKMNDSCYTLLPRSAFFEFIDVLDGSIILSDKVIPGKKYQLVVTTFSGLYRYKTDDIISITGFTGQSPKFLVFAKKNHSLNIGGENINDFLISMVIERLSVLFNLNLKSYYAGIDSFSVPRRYVLFLDVKNHLANGDLQVQEIERAFDRILQDIDWNYMDLRCLHIIDAPICRILPENIIKNYDIKGNSPILSDLKTKNLLEYFYKKGR